MRRIVLPVRTLVLAAAALAVAATPGAATLLALERGAVLGGELWRPLTGHLVHGGGGHLVLDVAGLLLVGLIFESCLGRSYGPVLALSALSVGAGVLVLVPELSSYCGLSGVLNGLWTAGALEASRRERSAGRRGTAVFYTLFVVGQLLKIAAEALSGASLVADETGLGGTPLPLSHALGALGGAMWALLHSRDGGVEPAARRDGRSMPVPQRSRI